MGDRIQIDDLEKLANLKASGALTDEEFRAMKQKIIGSPHELRAETTEAPPRSTHSDGYSFAEAVESGFSQYATFAGRAPRSEYWYWTLFVVACSFVIGIVDVIAGTTMGRADIGIFGLIFTLITLLPGLSICVRRMHDISRSGWWVWLAVVPIVGWIILLIFSCTRGVEGTNEYGPDPLA